MSDQQSPPVLQITVDTIDKITKLPTKPHKDKPYCIGWKKICNDGVSSCALTFVFLLLLSTAIAALIIANKYDTKDCMSKYSGIDIRYDLWLKINGGVEIAFLSLIALFVCSATTGKKNSCRDTFITLLVIVDVLFQFIWHIVGIVLYFHTTFETCASNTMVYTFGFTMVILKTVVYVLMIWGCWAKTLNFTQTQ